MNSDPYRTYHANQALELSELVNLQFARVRYGTSTPRLIRMRQPDGPSTDDGRKARQALVLVDDPSEIHGLVFGFVDLFKRTVDLRGYTTMQRQHEQRFGFALDMSNSEYARMIEELRTFLATQAYETRIVNQRPDDRPRGSGDRSRSPGLSGLYSAQAAPVAPAASMPVRLLVAPMLLSGAIGFAVCYLLVELRVLPF